MNGDLNEMIWSVLDNVLHLMTVSGINMSLSEVAKHDQECESEASEFAIHCFFHTA